MQLSAVGQGRLLLPEESEITPAQQIYALYFAACFCQNLTVSACQGKTLKNSRESWLRRVAAFISPSIVIENWPDSPPPKYDLVFGCRAADAAIAQAAAAQFIPVNIDREIEAAELQDYFEGGDRANQPGPAGRVCIIGPESTGKSTLAKNLARAFGATLVPEYAREHLTYRDSALEALDLELIARGQFASQSVLASVTKNILIADSDLMTTSLYAEALFGHCPAWIEELSSDPSQIFDLYLLTSPDVPWTDDAHRVDREGRAKFFEGCQQKLIARGLPYVLIEGDWQGRFDLSVNALKKHLQKGP